MKPKRPAKSGCTDLSAYVPPPLRAAVPKLWLTKAAKADADAWSRDFELPDAAQVLENIAASAAGFITSDYFVSNDWFPTEPMHPFRAVHFNLKDGRQITPVMVIEQATGLIYSDREVDFPIDYDVRRIQEEARTEYEDLVR